jgi:hypothetical protein
MSPNMIETFDWLREHGFMASREETEELLVRNRGREDGIAVGTWVIDGNTSDETCRSILAQMEACEWDGPELRLGQWADDPSFADILADLSIEAEDESEADLFCTYSDAWYEGVYSEVERACLARIGVES